jgi:hypothetical protein
MALFSGLFAGIVDLASVYYIHEYVDLIFSQELAKLIVQNKIEYTIVEASFVLILSLLISFITVFGVLIKNRFK